jgi:hypothetical protein
MFKVIMREGEDDHVYSTHKTFEVASLAWAELYYNGLYEDKEIEGQGLLVVGMDGVVYTSEECDGGFGNQALILSSEVVQYAVNQFAHNYNLTVLVSVALAMLQSSLEENTKKTLSVGGTELIEVINELEEEVKNLPEEENPLDTYTEEEDEGDEWKHDGGPDPDIDLN